MLLLERQINRQYLIIIISDTLYDISYILQKALKNNSKIIWKMIWVRRKFILEKFVQNKNMLINGGNSRAKVSVRIPYSLRLIYDQGIESGKIHLGLHRLDQIKKEEINEEEPYMAVLQFYLKEAEGIFIDTDEYEQGEQRYHAVVEISGAEGTTLDLGYGKIEPEEKHNFVTFDQAAYTVRLSYWL